MAILYEDKRIICDEDGLTIGAYYFPFGQSKRVYYRDIKALTTYTMGVHTGRYRIWGAGDPRYWLNLDWSRPQKEKLIVLELGRFVRPVITPDDVSAVVQILEEKTGLSTEHKQG